MDPEGMIALCKYEDDGCPYFYLFKDGLIEEKCVSTNLLYKEKKNDLYTKSILSEKVLFLLVIWMIIGFSLLSTWVSKI